MYLLARILTLFVLVLPALSPADAQSWPTRPIKIIVSQAAGGTPDIICRLISERLSAALGQPIIVEDRPGGANVVGALAAAHAPADGYTLFFATAAALVSNPHTFKSLPYDPLKDFVAVSMVAKKPFLILAHPSVPALDGRTTLHDGDVHVGQRRLARLAPMRDSQPHAPTEKHAGGNAATARGPRGASRRAKSFVTME